MPCKLLDGHPLIKWRNREFYLWKSIGDCPAPQPAGRHGCYCLCPTCTCTHFFRTGWMISHSGPPPPVNHFPRSCNLTPACCHCYPSSPRSSSPPIERLTSWGNQSPMMISWLFVSCTYPLTDEKINEPTCSQPCCNGMGYIYIYIYVYVYHNPNVYPFCIYLESILMHVLLKIC